MAVPKKRKSHSRTGHRRSSYARRTRFLPLTKCDNCGRKKVNHQACPHCGAYRKKIIVQVS